MQSASGYQAGSAATVVNPVTLACQDFKGRTTGTIVARRCCVGGALTAGDQYFPEQWLRWRGTAWDDQNRMQYQRTYTEIPASGEGVQGVHYFQTAYEYSTGPNVRAMISPDGTQTRTVYDLHGRSSEKWVGTDAAGAVDKFPAGQSGAGNNVGNNMVKIAAFTYDNWDGSRRQQGTG